MKGRLVIDGNAVYDIDEGCLCRKLHGRGCRRFGESDRKEQAEIGRHFESSLAVLRQKTGLNGEGVGIAVIDSGAAPHSDIAGQICGFYDCVNGRGQPYDDHGHGTHICGILAGNGTLSEGRVVGVAPGAQLYVLKVLDERGECSRYRLYRAIDRIHQIRKEWNIRIVNISIGGDADADITEDSQLIREINSLWDVGLVVCIAAGNQGSRPGSISAPGISRKVITVGAYDDGMPGSRGIKKDYSGRGPTSACILKPELVLRGTDILAANAAYVNQNGAAPPYIRRSGTSMATPFASGAIALLLQKYPWLTNVEVKLRLRDSCASIGLSANHQGWGKLDMLALLEGQTP